MLGNNGYNTPMCVEYRHREYAHAHESMPCFEDESGYDLVEMSLNFHNLR
jgi:hypothetical protein